MSDACPEVETVLPMVSATIEVPKVGHAANTIGRTLGFRIVSEQPSASDDIVQTPLSERHPTAIVPKSEVT